MVITMKMENFAMKKILFDQGNLVDIPYDKPVYDFFGKE